MTERQPKENYLINDSSKNVTPTPEIDHPTYRPADKLKDKVAIVTGAALGLGRGEAILLGKEGAKVAVVDINDEAGKETVEIIRNAGGEAEYWHLNVANEAECKTVIDAVVEKWGKLDILVNNAGIVGEDVPTDKTTEENWDKVFAVNVKSTFFMTKHSIPHMRNNGKGAIVNTSSICGLVGDGELSSYHATKGAILQMTKQDAAEYDYLIGMDANNIRNMKRIADDKYEEKIKRLLDFTDCPRDIADPWYTGDFDKTYEDVVCGCKALLLYLMNKHSFHPCQ